MGVIPLNESKRKYYTVTGMSCAACSARVEKCVAALHGVSSCSVNLLTGDLSVEGDVEEGLVTDAVIKAGYGCCTKEAQNRQNERKDNGRNAQKEAKEKLQRDLIVSVILLLPLLYFSMGVNMLEFPVPSFCENNPMAIGLIELILSSVILVINRRFFIRGISGLLRKAPNMDTLVGLGSGVSYLWSVYILFRMTVCYNGSLPAEEALTEAVRMAHELYFESAAMILVMITIGKMLEAGSREKTTDAVKGLLNLRPQTAILLDETGERLVNAEDLRKGDRFVLKPGASVPADGIILEGHSAVDESMLTGESIPVEKCSCTGHHPERENRVFAATINRSGRLLCEVEKTGEETVLSQIIRMVNDANASKAPVAKLADRVSGIFVPVILCIAFVTLSVWLILGADLATAISYGVSVLVISCPCALGLATPVAIMVGSGVGARNGILFKSSEALEMTGKGKTAVFDKTGTITTGTHRVTGVYPADGFEKDQLLKIAVSLEKPSEHPLAKAICGYCARKGIPAEEISGFTADGSMVKGTLDEKTLIAGSRKTLEKEGVDSESLSGTDELALQLESEGKTTVYFACETGFAGIIACEDTLRDGITDAVGELKELGLETVLLSGDHPVTTASVAKQAGIDQVKAGVLPAGKADEIRKLKENGSVLMVGDGINDAIALKTADIGISVASGTDIAMDACDIILMKSDPKDVAAAVRLSRQTLKNIRQNLFWAFFYNALMIPLAAGVFSGFGLKVSPMISACCMSLSSLFVVTNALRLRSFDIYGNKKKQHQKEKEMETVVTVKGMMCPHCEKRVEDAMLKVAGVTEAKADHVKGIVTVKGNAVRADLVKAVTDAGYEAE